MRTRPFFCVLALICLLYAFAYGVVKPMQSQLTSIQKCEVQKDANSAEAMLKTYGQ